MSVPRHYGVSRRFCAILFPKTGRGVVVAETPSQKIKALKKQLAAQDAELVRLFLALSAIAEMPSPDQDNAISANMRKIAAQALVDPVPARED